MCASSLRREEALSPGAPPLGVDPLKVTPQWSVLTGPGTEEAARVLGGLCEGQGPGLVALWSDTFGTVRAAGEEARGQSPAPGRSPSRCCTRHPSPPAPSSGLLGPLSHPVPSGLGTGSVLRAPGLLRPPWPQPSPSVSGSTAVSGTCPPQARRPGLAFATAAPASPPPCGFSAQCSHRARALLPPPVTQRERDGCQEGVWVSLSPWPGQLSAGSGPCRAGRRPAGRRAPQAAPLPEAFATGTAGTPGGDALGSPSSAESSDPLERSSDSSAESLSPSTYQGPRQQPEPFETGVDVEVKTTQPASRFLHTNAQSP
ncbi:cystatin-B isoform X1 [Hippopotamus amphibius kiboko]|uniref:cystatin-B isoform X1 n=1 Tax=Hippopotamus amphibius kiboko TaxID=575201 RepID=UPI00259683B7|nr:cystatin-B isoform X1 [Hippopotamus amphibius kiboko]